MQGEKMYHHNWRGTPQVENEQQLSEPQEKQVMAEKQKGYHCLH